VKLKEVRNSDGALLLGKDYSNDGMQIRIQMRDFDPGKGWVAVIDIVEPPSYWMDARVLIAALGLVTAVVTNADKILPRSSATPSQGAIVIGQQASASGSSNAIAAGRDATMCPCGPLPVRSSPIPTQAER
jgi:hypothetical protein